MKYREFIIQYKNERCIHKCGHKKSLVLADSQEATTDMKYKLDSKLITADTVEGYVYLYDYLEYFFQTGKMLDMLLSDDPVVVEIAISKVMAESGVFEIKEIGNK